MTFNSYDNYLLNFPEKELKIPISGEDLYHCIVNGNADLKEIYLSLARATETGSDLQIGIVVGQVLKKLENIINERKTY